MSNQILAVGGWEQWHEWHAKILQPVVDWFCATVPADARSVLDAACGTGLPSIAVAQRLAPTGRVLATDVSEVMIASAQRKSAAAGVTNIEHRAADLNALALPDGSFDAVTCSFGIIYSADPARAVGELRRVLKPGGMLAATAWDVAEKNAYFTTLFGTLTRQLGAPAPDPKTPGPLRLSAPGALVAAFEAAGFSAVKVESREVIYETESVEQHWQIAGSLVAPLANALKTLPAAEIERLRGAMADAVAPFVVNGRVRLRNTALCASARR